MHGLMILYMTYPHAVGIAASFYAGSSSVGENHKTVNVMCDRNDTAVLYYFDHSLVSVLP